jgi:hypothetical protein
MPDYQNGKIYTIRCRSDNTFIYVGSTTQPLAKRWGEHKPRGNNVKYQNMILYKTINNNWDDWYIELYEECPCENKEQLCRREGEIIREIGTLNSTIAGRTQKEYYENNAEKIKEQVRLYRENNKEKKREQEKLYRENNKDKHNEKSRERITCECGCIIRRSDISTHKKTQKHIKTLNPV